MAASFRNNSPLSLVLSDRAAGNPLGEATRPLLAAVGRRRLIA